jgi:ATP phosphoribosyltransferase regulatory subunit
MAMLYNKTPDGTRDLLFEECDAYNITKEKLRDLFGRRGYNEVVTPTLEYYDLFAKTAYAVAQEDVYKFTDRTGRLLVLRPDITLPIARLAATRLRDRALPLRLHYCENVFNVSPDYKGRSNEVVQSGIELIGSGDILADLEVIVTAAEALKTVNTSEFKIEIGHIGVFNALVDALDVDDNTRENIRLNIESKNYASLDIILDKLGDSAAVGSMRMLPRLFGGVEVLDEAAKMFGNAAEQPLKYLRTLWEKLTALELDRYVNFDLGLVHRNNYYTGVIFRGYVSGSGTTVLSGGRYDKLLSEFGINLPATGFAIDINAIAAVSSGRPEADSDTVLIFAKDEIGALRRLKELCDSGKRCELFRYESDEKCRELCSYRGAERFEIIGQEAAE